MQPQIINGMMPGPAGVAEILKTLHRAAEKRTRIYMALATHGILEIRVYLHFLGEFWGADFDERCLDCFHETSIVIKRDTPRS